jgi:hypothetical protein
MKIDLLLRRPKSLKRLYSIVNLNTISLPTKARATKISSLGLAPTHEKVWGLHVPWLYGNSNYLQCFPVGVLKGEKVGQIDIIYVRGKFRQSTLGNSNWPQFSQLTHTWWAPVHQWWTTCLHFLNAKYFSDQRKLSVQDVRITLLKTSNLEQREGTQRLEKKSAKYPLAIINFRVKFWLGTTENFKQPQLSLLLHDVHHPRRTSFILFLSLPS